MTAHEDTREVERRAGERRLDPMGDAAAEEALRFLGGNADAAGVAKAQMIYLEHHRKSELARLKRLSTEKTAEAREAWARDHADYRTVLEAQWEAVRAHETLAWRKAQAEATLDAWRTRNANNRIADKFR